MPATRAPLKRALLYHQPAKGSPGWTTRQGPCMALRGLIYRWQTKMQMQVTAQMTKQMTMQEGGYPALRARGLPPPPPLPHNQAHNQAQRHRVADAPTLTWCCCRQLTSNPLQVTAAGQVVAARSASKKRRSNYPLCKYELTKRQLVYAQRPEVASPTAPASWDIRATRQLQTVSHKLHQTCLGSGLEAGRPSPCEQRVLMSSKLAAGDRRRRDSEESLGLR